MVVSQPSYSTSQYLQQAQKAIDKFEYELAIKILKRAFAQDPHNSFISFSIATCLLELDNARQEQEPLANAEMLVGDSGDNDEDLLDGTRSFNAKEWLERALQNLDIEGPVDAVVGVQVPPQAQRWQIYLSLAQLSVGEKSVEYYEASVADLKKTLALLENDLSQEDCRNTLIRTLSNAFCALCEIYMTDCCDLPEAESKCIDYISEAESHDPQNPEVFSTKASILLSRCMPDQARLALLKNLDLWYVDPHKQQQLSADTLDQDGKNLEEEMVDLTAFSSSWPSFDVRLVIAKLLVEVDEYKRAVAVIETLFAENDEWWEVWYLFGISYMRMAEEGREGNVALDGDGCRMMLVDGDGDGDCSSSSAADILDPVDVEGLLLDAKDCFEKILQLNEKFVATGQEPLDESVIQETEELLRELQVLADSATMTE